MHTCHSVFILQFYKFNISISYDNSRYVAACRRHRSSAGPPSEGAEGTEERIKGIPTKEELRSQGSPLQDQLQRTGDYKQTDVKMLSQEEGEKIYILRYGVMGKELYE